MAIRVRMYRTGFGDCFLLSFGAAAKRKHILIDFGAHMHGDIDTMGEVMAQIEEDTKRKLAVIVATHAHRDHISGFGKFAQRFRQFAIGEVWLPWTDNPNDKKAAALQKKQNALYDRLDKHLRLNARDDGTYKAALNALKNLTGNKGAMDALRNGFDTDAKTKYLRAGMLLRKPGGIAGLCAQILSPPNDTTFFSRMNPPAHQRYLDGINDAEYTIEPFPKGAHQTILSVDERKKLEDAVAAPADRLALVLDNARNNTSLVILFKFEGRLLLFPGDAQWGNWQSWIDSDAGKALLPDLDFLKLAHHGSHNATPVSVVQALRAKGLTAMMSTQIEPYPTIPRMPLVDELQTHCNTVVLRSDWVTIDKAPAGPAMPKRLPRGTKIDKFWIDYSLTAKGDDE